MKFIRTELCDLLGIEYPIIQGGMGPYNTTHLAAAVSNAGGLGTVSIPGLTTPPDRAGEIMASHIRIVKSLTSRPFAVNSPVGEVEDVIPTTDAYIDTILQEREADPQLAKQLRVVLTSAGHPKRYVKKIRDAGLLHFHVVGSVRHARKIEEMGLTGVIASGFEMGGHTHLVDRAVHTFILIPAVAQAVKIPVVASGGICDSATLVAALAMGAQGVQMGTRFLATQDNTDFHENYRRAIVEAGEWSDRLVPGVYGPLRCLKNPGAEDVDGRVKAGMPEEELNRYKDMLMTLAERDGDVKRGLLIAGQVASRIEDLPSVRDLIQTLMRGAVEILEGLQMRVVR